MRRTHARRMAVPSSSGGLPISDRNQCVPTSGFSPICSRTSTRSLHKPWVSESGTARRDRLGGAQSSGSTLDRRRGNPAGTRAAPGAKATRPTAASRPRRRSHPGPAGLATATSSPPASRFPVFPGGRLHPAFAAAPIQSHAGRACHPSDCGSPGTSRTPHHRRSILARSGPPSVLRGDNHFPPRSALAPNEPRVSQNWTGFGHSRVPARQNVLEMRHDATGVPLRAGFAGS